MKFSIKIGKIKMTLHFQVLRKRKVKKIHRSWSQAPSSLIILTYGNFIIKYEKFR